MTKILIVDDDNETISLLSSLLAAGGYEPCAETISRHAIDTAHSVRPNLILLDIMMHELNGIELCRMFKNDSALANIPIVMVSALNDQGSKNDSFKAGAIDFITKPINNKDFMDRVHSALGE
jgi:CheY-like chemotaxis protein